MIPPARDTWLPADPADALGLLPVGGPELHDLYEGLWDRDVDPVTLELCRLRLAQLVGSRADLETRDERAVAAGLTDELVAALPDWPSSPLFSDAQRSALEFAELYTIDAHGVSDDDTTRLQQHFSAPQLATLTIALATFDALARVRALLQEH
jgi:alkylhydroperoxidase family enzyme